MKNTEPTQSPLGRPHKPDSEKLIQRSIRLTRDQWAKVDSIGLPTIRSMIEKIKTR